MTGKASLGILSMCLLVGCYEMTYSNQEIPSQVPRDAYAAEAESEPLYDEASMPDTVIPTEPCGAFTLGVEMSCDETMSVYSASPYFMTGNEPILHMIGAYEATSAHHSDYHPTGTTLLSLGRTLRPVVLVLSSYEPIEWVIERAPGAVIEKILLYGYYPQTVRGVDDVLVIDRSDGEFYAYGYCWPSCSGGSDTPALVADVEMITGLTVSTFSGCYHLEEISLAHRCYPECTPEDACAGWECGVNEACGIDCGRCPDAAMRCVEHRCLACEPSCSGRVCGDDGCGGSCGTCPAAFFCMEGQCSDRCAWTPMDFFDPPDPISCDGRHFVRFDEHYGLWVGLVQCPTGYRFYLSELQTGPFFPVTDTAGHGQDFCELMNPSFTLPNEDDITSGGCLACSTGPNTPLEGVTAWARGYFGESFYLISPTGTWSWQTSVVNCDVDVSSPPGAVLFCM